MEFIYLLLYDGPIIIVGAIFYLILMLTTIGWTDRYKQDPKVLKEAKEREAARKAMREANGWKTADELYKEKLARIQKANSELPNNDRGSSG